MSARLMSVRLLLAAGAALLLSAASAEAGPLSLPKISAPSSIERVAVTIMRVKTSYAHLRAKPTTKSDKLATLKHGTKVDVLELVEHGKWAHVNVAGKNGYISANLLMM